MEDPGMGLPLLSLVRRGHYAGSSDCGGVDGVQLPRCACGHRKSVYRGQAEAHRDRVGDGRARVDPRTVAVVYKGPSDWAADRLYVRPTASRCGSNSEVRRGRESGDDLIAVERLSGWAVRVVSLIVLTAYLPNRLTAQVSIHASIGARYSTTLVKDSAVVPIEL